MNNSKLLLALAAAYLSVLPPAARAESTLLINGFIHTVSGGTLTNGAVLIDGETIAQLLDGSKPLGVIANKVVDLRGAHVYPGLVAMDTSLGIEEIDAIRATQDTTEVGTYTPDVKSWIAVNPDSELIPVARANGIAYAEPAPQGGVVDGVSGVIKLNGWTTEQMTIKKPAALHVNWPSMTLDTTPKEKFKDSTKFKSLEDQAKERKKKLEELDAFFQEARAYEQLRAKPSSSDGKPGTPIIPAWEAMLPVVRGELSIVIHANEELQVTSALKWAETNHFKIILAGALQGWRVADKIAAAKVPVLFEFTMLQPRRETDNYDTQFRAAEVYHKAGVTLAIGEGNGGMGASNLRNLPYSASRCIAFGLPEDEALKAITLTPAQLLGMDKRIGSIEVGKEASLFVCDGDLFQITSNVKQMWIAGKEISLESRHTRLYERYKNRPKP